MSIAEPAQEKRMRLRYAGTCRACGAAIAAGQQAIYLRATKQVACLSCQEGERPAADATIAPSGPTTTAPEPVEVGVAGASARREHQRRVAKREASVRTRHPMLGGLLLAVTDEPQSTRAWDVGARGEEQLAKRLNDLVEQGVLVLHDRRIRGTKANIDHIVIGAAGVFVIDAKRYQGRPTLKIEGGILRARTETLMVGRRDCTKLLQGVTKQVDLVKAALATLPDTGEVSVRGMLCFVDADWPMFGGSFSTGGVGVLWPAKAAAKITAAGPISTERAHVLHRRLAQAFPIA
ncbi:MAG: nuclease-related domain-containing protein [Jatrophihabitans sp.]